MFPKTIADAVPETPVLEKIRTAMKEAGLIYGMDVFGILRDNDAYRALKETGGLIITGATGTNVNDVTVALLKQ